MRPVFKPLTYSLIAYSQSLKLLPECFVLLVCLCFFGGLGVVLEEPGEVVGIAILSRSICSRQVVLCISLYLFLCYTEATFKKKIQAKGGLCWGKDKRRRTNGGKDKRRRTNGGKDKRKRTNGGKDKRRRTDGRRIRGIQ